MKPEWRRFAPLGLYLAIIATLVSLGLWIVFQTFGLPLQISLGLIVIGLALFAALDPSKVRVVFTGRGARNSGNLLIAILAFAGIVVVVNYLAVQVGNLYPDKTRWDLTEDKSNTLAAESIDVLDRLPQPVVAQAFFTQSSSPASARDWLDKYKSSSKGKFTYEVIDPDEKPTAARAAGVPQGKDGVIALMMGERHEIVSSISEQEITNGLIRLLSDEKRTLYFLTGHGEHDPMTAGDGSYAQLKSTLETKNYVVKTLNLRATGVIPEDAKLVVVGGPTQALTPEEVAAISDFSAKGGALIVLSDPPLQNNLIGAADPLADYLVNTWGIALGNDVVIQVAGNKPSAAVVGYQFANHPIAQKLQNNQPFFILARSLQSTNLSDVKATALVESTPYMDNCYPYCTWASTDMQDLSAWFSNKKDFPANPTTSDLLGPVPLVFSAEKGASKLVAFGDSDFAADAYIQGYGNSDLLVNSIDWVVGQENLINLTAKTQTQRSLIAPSNLQMTSNLLLLILVIGMPGLVILLGVVSWYFRRRRG